MQLAYRVNISRGQDKTLDNQTNVVRANQFTRQYESIHR